MRNDPVIYYAAALAPLVHYPISQFLAWLDGSTWHWIWWLASSPASFIALLFVLPSYRDDANHYASAKRLPQNRPTRA